MRNFSFTIQSSEIFFLLAGVCILFSLPWLEGAGFSLWVLAKALYITGVILLIFRK